MKYNDIIQWEFIDNYYNNTLKGIGILRWTLFHCTNVRFIMRLDDDILLNPFSLNQFINNILYSKKTIFGTLGEGYKPHRSNDSKWYISHKSYPQEYYPSFIFGPYLMSSDSIFPIYKEILNSLPALAFDDVYISGIIAQKCNIIRKNTKKFVRLDFIGVRKNQITSQMFKENVLFSHDFRHKDLETVWDKLCNGAKKFKDANNLNGWV